MTVETEISNSYNEAETGTDIFLTPRIKLTTLEFGDSEHDG